MRKLTDLPFPVSPTLSRPSSLDTPQSSPASPQITKAPFVPRHLLAQEPRHSRLTRASGAELDTSPRPSCPSSHARPRPRPLVPARTGLISSNISVLVSNMEASSSQSASTSTSAADAAQAGQHAEVGPPLSTTFIPNSPSSNQTRRSSPGRSRARSPAKGNALSSFSYGRAVDADTRGETSASGARRAMAETYRPLGSEDYRNRPATAPKSGLIGSIALGVSSSSGPGHRDLPGGQADGPPPTSSLATGRLSPIPRTNAYDSPKPDTTPSPHTIQTSSNSRPRRLSSDMDVDPDPSVAVDVKVAAQPPRSSSSLSPLPAMYALASSSQRSIDPEAQGEEDDDDDDEVISSSEKGEGDAALLLPVSLRLSGAHAVP